MPPFPVRRFTVAEYHGLVQSGALEEDDRVELLEGWIVPKVTQYPQHAWTVTQVAQLLAPLLTAEWLMRVQCAMTTDDSEPEPDNAVVRAPNEQYLRRHPTGEDIGLLIEVSETTVAKDRRKAAIYAAAGIPVYWIINLVDRQIEVHTKPDSAIRTYGDVQKVKPGATVEIVLDGNTMASLDVDKLLPPLTA